MQNLEFKQSTIDSKHVAQMLEKEHSKLLRDIETYSKYLTEAKIGLSDFFLKSQYLDSTGRTLPCYLITKKGCEFLAHKLTGQKGAIFTAKDTWNTGVFYITKKIKIFQKTLDFYTCKMYNIFTVKITKLYKYTGQDVERRIKWKIWTQANC